MFLNLNQWWESKAFVHLTRKVMASNFESLKEAKQEFTRRTGETYDLRNHHPSGERIFNRNKNRRKNKLKKPYFVGTYMQWLNL